MTGRGMSVLTLTNGSGHKQLACPGHLQLKLSENYILVLWNMLFGAIEGFSWVLRIPYFFPHFQTNLTFFGGISSSNTIIDFIIKKLWYFVLPKLGTSLFSVKITACATVKTIVLTQIRYNSLQGSVRSPVICIFSMQFYWRGVTEIEFTTFILSFGSKSEMS